MRYAEVQMGTRDGVQCTCSTSMAILEMIAALRPLDPGRSFDTGDTMSERGDGGECSPTLKARVLREIRAEMGGMFATRSWTDNMPLPASSSARKLIDDTLLSKSATVSSSAFSESAKSATSA